MIKKKKKMDMKEKRDKGDESTEKEMKNGSRRENYFGFGVCS